VDNANACGNAGARADAIFAIFNIQADSPPTFLDQQQSPQFSQFH
jgi:hypothetical protein